MVRFCFDTSITKGDDGYVWLQLHTDFHNRALGVSLDGNKYVLLRDLVNQYIRRWAAVSKQVRVDS